MKDFTQGMMYSKKVPTGHWNVVMMRQGDGLILGSKMIYRHAPGLWIHDTAGVDISIAFSWFQSYPELAVLLDELNREGYGIFGPVEDIWVEVAVGKVEVPTEGPPRSCTLTSLDQ